MFKLFTIIDQSQTVGGFCWQIEGRDLSEDYHYIVMDAEWQWYRVIRVTL